MRMILKKNKKKKNGLLITIAILISVMTMTFLFINYYSKKALPIILSYAEAETKKLTILVINKAVTKQINNMDTDELFDIAYNKDGEITLTFNNKVPSILDYIKKIR